MSALVAENSEPAERNALTNPLVNSFLASRSRLAGLLIAAIFLGAALFTWRMWPDPLVDFGNQLYLPWRISLGDSLYKDVMYLTGGPLSQYYHGLLFKIFGPSLSVLIFSNLAMLAGVLLVLYRRFAASSSPATATMICAGILLVFAFNQYSNIGNYNFVTPYCHEVWHGLVLSIAAICLLTSLNAKLGGGDLLAGSCVGLVFMTKPEVFAALGMAFIACFILLWAKAGLWQALRRGCTWVAGALLPLVLFLIYFHCVEDWPGSFRSVCYAWVPLLGSPVSQQPFYKWCLGLDAPLYHLRLMALHIFTVIGVVAICGFWFRQSLNTSPRRIMTAGLIGLLAALATGIDWVDCGRSLPFLALALCVASLTQLKSIESKNLFPFLWGVFALGLLAKLGWYPRIWHYGFALAMPAFAGAIFLLLWSVPARLEKYGVNSKGMRFAIGLCLMIGCLRLFVQSGQVYRTKTTPIAGGSDRFMAFNAKTSPAAPAVQTALAWLQANTSPDSTVSVLPEGVMLNYLSRRKTPAHYLVWNPAELAAFGQENMTVDFENARPDYVVLIHRDAAEYGATFFGQEEKFGLELMRWIEKNYQPVLLIGNEPLKNSLFGIKILKRVSNSGAACPRIAKGPSFAAATNAGTFPVYSTLPVLPSMLRTGDRSPSGGAAKLHSSDSELSNKTESPKT
jgi:hypothetical protein